MKNLIYFFLILNLLMGCSESEEVEKPNSKLFRDIYNNTFWYDNSNGQIEANEDGEWYSFSPDKLIFIIEKYKENTGCYSFKEGTFEKIRDDKCVYNKITYLVVSETESSFKFKETISSGVSDPGFNDCFPGETVFTFTAINNNLIEYKIDYGDNDIESGSFGKGKKSFTLKNCLSGPSEELGFLRF